MNEITKSLTNEECNIIIENKNIQIKVLEAKLKDQEIDINEKEEAIKALKLKTSDTDTDILIANLQKDNEYLSKNLETIKENFEKQKQQINILAHERDFAQIELEKSREDYKELSESKNQQVFNKLLAIKVFTESLHEKVIEMLK